MRCVCICCRRRSSRVPQILTRRSQSALGFDTASFAAQNGHLHILEYLVERKFDKYNEDACTYAAENGHFDCLKYLHETAKAPWDSGRYEERTRTTKPNVYNTSSTTTVLTRWLAIRTWRATHDLKSQVSFINKKRIRERRNSFRFRTREIREYTQRDNTYIEIWC